MITVTVIPVDGQSYQAAFLDPLRLQDWYNLIHTDIVEVLNIEGDQEMILDEEGLLKKSDINSAASMIALRDIYGIAVLQPKGTMR